MHGYALAALAAAILVSAPAAAQISPCGERVRVERGDTISRIAERCNVREAQILRANPRVQGSEDLRVGMELRLASGQRDRLDGALDRLRGLADEAGDAVQDLAGRVGRSVDEFLDANPDVRDRLRRLGDRLDVPGVDAQRADVSVTPDEAAPGATVTISAVGLPANVPVVIGAGRRGAAHEGLQEARTDGRGTVQANVQVPAWAEDRLAFVVVGVDRDFRVRSEPIRITDATATPRR
jgi:LysM repeat protein